MEQNLGWELREDSFSPAEYQKNETLFSQGNGYIGFRGNFEEGYSKNSVTGSYLNGFFEFTDIQYGEIAFAYPEHGQTMLNVANAKVMRIWVDGEMFSLESGEVLRYERVFSFRTGVLSRKVEWRAPNGKELEISLERFVSQVRKNIAVIRCSVKALNFSGEIGVESVIDGNVTNLTCEEDSRVGSALHGRVLDAEAVTSTDNLLSMVQKTRKSGLALCCAAVHKADGAEAAEHAVQQLNCALRFAFSLKEGETARVEKYIAYQDSRYAEDYAGQAVSLAEEAAAAGFDTLLSEQEKFLADFWQDTDIEIDGDPSLQQGIRFNIFHLLQSTGHDGKTSIAAKGLTGEGYEGHYFWDCETYVFPVFLCTRPEIAKQLLTYRHSILDKARERAREMGHPKGALFPWRSINGAECSPNYPSGTAQYHINADIAYAVKSYWEATGDREFMEQYGLEILVETARLWYDLGFFCAHKGGKFCLNFVTGPDEYTAVVNNNCYTNLMAKNNMLFAAKMARMLGGWERFGLSEEEIAGWEKAGAEMYLPYDEKTGLYQQCDGFFDLEKWDFANTPKENYPLLLHYHPLVIYRHQVCKQGDLVQAMYMLPDEFRPEDKKPNYDYYEAITTHDSSLSNSVFGIMASELGDPEKAYRYFISTARMDIDDGKGNTKDGVHTANMGGTWMGVINGFAGMRVRPDCLSFKPALPAQWGGCRFQVTYHGSKIRVEMSADHTRYTLVSGNPASLCHNGEAFTLEGTREF